MGPEPEETAFVAAEDDPITAQYVLVAIDHVTLERDSDAVPFQLPLALPYQSIVQLHDPTLITPETMQAWVVVSEQAVRAPGTGEVVPRSALAELKAQHELAAKQRKDEEETALAAGRAAKRAASGKPPRRLRKPAASAADPQETPDAPLS